MGRAKGSKNRPNPKKTASKKGATKTVSPAASRDLKPTPRKKTRVTKEQITERKEAAFDGLIESCEMNLERNLRPSEIVKIARNVGKMFFE